MMYPETFADDKGVLNAYENEYGYYQESTGFQRVCCIKESAQFCPKCGCYHQNNSVKSCLCLTVTSLMACICFVILTLSVTFHVEDMQNGYETVHHFLNLVTNTKSNDTVEISTSFETQSTSTETESSTTTELPLSISLDDATEINEDYVYDLTENDENYSYNERVKRSAVSVDVPNNESSINEDFDCISFLLYSNNSSNSTIQIKGNYVGGGSEYLKRYEYCNKLVRDTSNTTVRGNVSESNRQLEKSIEVTEDNRADILHTPLKNEENSLKIQNTDKIEEKYSQKRSYFYDYTPKGHQYPYYESGASYLQGDPDIVPISRASDQKIPYITGSVRTRPPYPPTGPDGSNYAESVKTSQQLTVANNQIWKPVCFRAQTPNLAPLLCLPMTSRQLASTPELLNHYINSDSFSKECVNGNCDKSQKSQSPPLPTVITPSTIPSDWGSDPHRQQPVLISPTNSPDIHVPTAISSPNPYFFPTFNGAPIMTHLPHESRQIPPYFSPVWPYRGSPGLPQMQPPYFYGPPRFPGGFNGYQQSPPQPQFHMLPPQSPADLQNPVFCMYVPSRSHQFPVVNGVMEEKNRNVEDSQSARQSQPATNSSSHQEFRSGNKDCGADEFACKRSSACVPMTNWCDGRVDCSDASDESECSCKHRMGKHRLCDGYFDCPSGEDELGCFGCDRDSFSCQDWERGRERSTCVPLSKMCDNVVDCMNHRDELECALLSESIIPHKTHFVSYARGILHRNWKGRWYPACTGPKVTEWALQACLADAGPLSGDPHIEMVSTEYPGPFIIPNGPKKYTLSQMCRDQKVVTYVTCPPVQCGTRVARPMLDSSVRAREEQLRKLNTMQWRSTETSGKDENEDSYVKEEYVEDPLKSDKTRFNNRERKAQHQENGYCESCNLEAKPEGIDWSSLIASKANEYQTQFEPIEEEHHLVDEISRWTRDADEVLGVVGGRRSRANSWPWLIALHKDGRFHCGGVIVSELWVMTAAHCMDQFSRHYFEVQAGMLRRFSFSPHEQTRRVSHVVLHNLYNIYDMQNDLALLRLHSKLKYNRWVRPICLPQEYISQYGPPPGSFCTAVGWGATEEGGNDPDDLHEVTVPILPYCKHRADQEGAGLCAGYLHGGHDACQGDSGGPLLCRLPEDDERWYVAGVVSHGEGCARPDEPGVYTRIFLFLDWIKSVINDFEDSLSPSQMPRQECPGKQCDSGRRCIPLSHLCDSKVDCFNAEDEIFCNENYLEKSPLPTDNDTNTRVTDNASIEKDYTPPIEESYGDKITIHEITRQPNENLMNQNDENYTENTDVEENPVYENLNDDKAQIIPVTEDPKRQLPSHEENEYATEDVVYGEAKSNVNSESQITIHEIVKQPNEYIKNQNYENYPEDTDFEEEPVYKNSNSKQLESKTMSKTENEPITENSKHNFPSQEENEYATEDVAYGEARSNVNSESQITIHEIEKQSNEYIKNQNYEHYTEDTDIEEEEPVYINSKSKPLESKTMSKTENEPITENSKHDLPSKEENEYATEDVAYGEARSNDESRKLSDKCNHEGDFPYSHDSQSLLEMANEENYPSTKSYLSDKEHEDDETGTSALDSETWRSTSITLENDGTTSTLPPLEVTTLNTYYKEDTQLINELVYQDKNTSEAEDHSVDVHIPSYLVPILFQNSTSRSKNHSDDEQNNKSKTHNKNFKSNEDTSKGIHIHPNAIENDSNTDKNGKDQRHFPGEKSNLIPTTNENEMETVITSTFSTLEDDHERTTLTTMPSNPKGTPPDSDSHKPSDEVKNDDGINENTNHFETSSSSDGMKIQNNETEDYESFCKNFTREKDSKSDYKDPEGGAKKNSSNIDKKIDMHEDVLDLSIGNKDMSNSTLKDVKTVKRESLFVCKRYKQPLLRKRRCDGVVDCEDGTDEAKCSCKERLTQLDPSLTCDGEVHCYDRSDEKLCSSKCNKTEYFCPRSKVCIPQASRCDRIRNCPENDDEENCYALTADGKIRLDRALVPEFSQEGIVATNSATGWRPLCVGPKSGHFVAIRVCTALGFLGYEGFYAEVVRNQSSKIHSVSMKGNTSVCSGLRVKCSYEKADKVWLGQLLVEGEFSASVAMIHPQWFLTHPSICRQLHLESQYAEISMGRNRVSDFGIRGVYEENRRIDDVISVNNSNFCLLHVETPLNFSHQVRPIKFQFSEEIDFSRDFYAVTLSGRGFHKLKLNQSKISRGNEELCFTITHQPSECYTHGGLAENGFIMMNMMYDSFVTSTFDSFQIFCNIMTDICLKKLSTFSSIILGVLDGGQVTPKASPPCGGIRCGKCVRWANVSDGEPDCSDRSDETRKAFNKRLQVCQSDPSVCGCRAYQFRCPSGRCIDKSSYCDGTRHCEDGSDEPTGCEDSCLTLLQFAYPHKICDGVRNCFDKSDEKWEICHNKTCTLKDAYVCKSSGKCIPQEFVCDDEADCPESDDEQNCVAILRNKLTEGTLSQQRFGVWSPKCYNDTTSDFTSFCSAMGLSEAVTREITTPNTTIVAADSFSPTRLNNKTTVVVRKGRPLVEIDSSLPCKYLYIKCL